MLNATYKAYRGCIIQTLEYGRKALITTTQAAFNKLNVITTRLQDLLTGAVKSTALASTQCSLKTIP
jgi:hypothetical protein